MKGKNLNARLSEVAGRSMRQSFGLIWVLLPGVLWATSFVVLKRKSAKIRRNFRQFISSKLRNARISNLSENAKAHHIKASTLDLNDAAYYLWNQKQRLDQIEQKKRKASVTAKDLADPVVFRNIVQHVIIQLRFDRQNAHLGPTFDRMKISHPCIPRRKIQAAIKSAVKFDTDCNKYFAYKSGSFVQDAWEAVEKARLENPDFSEETYNLAFHSMCIAMR